MIFMYMLNVLKSAVVVVGRDMEERGGCKGGSVAE
jgi:hypothetical protein